MTSRADTDPERYAAVLAYLRARTKEEEWATEKRLVDIGVLSAPAKYWWTNDHD